MQYALEQQLYCKRTIIYHTQAVLDGGADSLTLTQGFLNQVLTPTPQGGGWSYERMVWTLRRKKIHPHPSLYEYWNHVHTTQHAHITLRTDPSPPRLLLNRGGQRVGGNSGHRWGLVLPVPRTDACTNCRIVTIEKHYKLVYTSLLGHCV